MSDNLKVSFRTFDSDFFLTLHINRDLYHSDFKLTLLGDNGEEELSSQQHLVAYAGVSSTGEWARATFFEDGTMHATVRVGDDVIVVDPVEHHSSRMYSSARRSALDHKMVAYRLSAVNLESAVFANDAMAPFRGTVLPNNVSALKNAGSRKVLATFAGCPNTLQALNMGVAADYGYVTAMGSASKALTIITAIFNSMNSVYNDQFKLQLVLKEAVIRNTAGGEPWNEQPSSPSAADCPSTISEKLSSFTAWREGRDDDNGLWMLMNNCYTSAGTVGLAWTGIACKQETVYCPPSGSCSLGGCDASSSPSDAYGDGATCASGANVVSNLGAETWIVAAHEIGHNLAASHDDNGIMGAVMDGSQFFSYKSGQEICGYVKSVRDGESGKPPNCFYDWAPICGNNITERGEECDDASSCCDPVTCQLIDGATCSAEPGSIDAECCTSCLINLTTTRCNGNLGFCSNGKCVISDCPKYPYGDFCGIDPDLPCKQRCVKDGSCTSDINANLPVAKLEAPELSLCGDGMVCSSGACVPVGFSWTPSAWTPCTASCGGGIQTREVRCQDPFGNLGDSCGNNTVATEQACNEQDCGAYYWKLGAFGACSAPCSGGIAVRTVQCFGRDEGTVVVASSCVAAEKPTNRTVCNTEECGDFNWVAGPWPAADECCGSETQTRSLSCQTINGSTVEDSRCSTVAPPATSRTCTSGRSCNLDQGEELLNAGLEQANAFYKWIDENTGGFAAIICGVLVFLILVCVVGACIRKRNKKKAAKAAAEANALRQRKAAKKRKQRKYESTTEDSSDDY